MLETKTFQDIKLYFDGLSDELEIPSEIPPGNVTVRGAKSVVAAWKPALNALRVLCGNIEKEGIYSLPVQAVIPGKLELIDANPKNIQIEVKKRTSEADD